MADLTRHELQMIDEHDHARDELTRSYLERAGVQVSIMHFEGDSSFPTEYRLRYSFVEAVGPTFDMAVAAFIEKLLKHVPVEQSIRIPPGHSVSSGLDPKV